MRHSIIILLLSSISLFSSTAATSDSALAEYLRGCELMTDALRSHDKQKLQRAIECFDLAGASTCEISSLKKDNPLSKPEYLFTAEFADELLLNDFCLAKLDPETLMRNSNSDSSLSLFHLYLNPEESALLEFEGENEMNIALSSGGIATAELSVSDPANNFSKTLPSSPDETTTINWVMASPSSATLSVKNTSDKGATFVVIFY